MDQATVMFTAATIVVVVKMGIYNNKMAKLVIQTTAATAVETTAESLPTSHLQVKWDQQHLLQIVIM
jgi:hypothetical protein